MSTYRRPTRHGHPGKLPTSVRLVALVALVPVNSLILALALVLAVVLGSDPGRAEADGAIARLAARILAETGVRGGIVVHLGCGDGRLTAALRASESFTVHGLDGNPANVRTAREHISGLGLYGPVSVERWSSRSLPYADNLINLVVAEPGVTEPGVTEPGVTEPGVADPVGAKTAVGEPTAAEPTAAEPAAIEPGYLVPREEIMRILAPGGVAYVRAADGSATDASSRIVKPRPGTIDEWSHFLHDAGNNAVARDEEVGPPRHLQWVAPPLWLRSHETPSGFQALVSSGGRVFYFFDEGPVGITDQRFPERWSLLCRDAFNGKLLWKRPVAPWGWPEWAAQKFEGQDWTEIPGGRTVVPDENQRSLVADGDRIYATLGFRSPLSILDAASGGLLATVKETEPVREVLASDGIVVVHASDPSAEGGARRRGQGAPPSRLVAVRGESGDVLWTKEADAIGVLLLAIDGGRVVFHRGGGLECLRLADGETLWQVDRLERKGRPLNLIAHDGIVLVYGQNALSAFDAKTGEPLWEKDGVPRSTGGESPDLFVASGVVWRGIVPIDGNLRPVGKSEDAMAVGYDLRTGEEERRIVARNLRSPEHHHRCYRNKATERYIISGMEGAEFLDLAGNDHCQNNWLRGACKLGIVPANGLLYVPPDQCFCQPGAKILGFVATRARAPSRQISVAKEARLERGETFGKVERTIGEASVSAEDWPTFRRNPARHGSTSSIVTPDAKPLWRAKLGGGLTAPVAAGGRVYVASRDAHTVHSLDAGTGEPLWRFVAGGRVDSPPTVHADLVIFGSADGRVYCLRASDGALLWRFLAAPSDRRIACFDQIESVWPVHGSVLVRDGVAYASAGRSTYLDGGIRVWALDPFSGEALHETTLEGPFPDFPDGRDFAFYVLGANSDVLVSEGEHVYLRQKKLSLTLEEVKTPVLSSKGAQDVGLHIFSTAGLLDGSWYNRTFWMYSKRWPGFQLANQAPKSGQLLVVDDESTYAVKVFYRRNVHSPMFFPGREGYLLFADRNFNEPQIVGEEGAREPVAWLPQSHIPRDGNPGLESAAFGRDKMIGYTRAEPPRWAAWVPVRIRAMVKAGDALFVAGPRDDFDEKDPHAALEGSKGVLLAAVSAKDGRILSERALEAPPVFDGLIAARGRLIVSLEDGTVACLGGKGDAGASAGR